jgi:plastocyanin
MRVGRAGFGLLFVLAAFGCGGSGAHAAATCATELKAAAPITDKGSRVIAGSRLTVDAANSAFAPTCVTGVPHGVLTLSVRNTGLVLHNIEIDAQHIDFDVAPRHTVVVRVTVGSDPIVYVCKYHRDLGMVGVLIPSTT